MKEFKGTQGEWRIASKNKDSQFYVIHGKDESCDSREVQICKINYGNHPVKEQLDVTEANARLISAAPMLLEALQDLVRYCKENKTYAELELAQKAIDKALK